MKVSEFRREGRFGGWRKYVAGRMFYWGPSIAYAQATVRRFLLWLEDRDAWEGPRRWERLFRGARADRLMTTAEREEAARPIPTFTYAEAALLLAAASPRQRLYLLLGLNLGLTSSEISDLTPGMFADGQVLERVRPKTTISGRWPLWPETLAAARPFLQARGERAFLTEQGLPLVREKRQDAIALAWARLMGRKRLGLPPERRLSFKYLRKSGSQWVRDIAGLEVSQAYLAHAEKSVAGRHYNNRDPGRLAEALEGVRSRLQDCLAIQSGFPSLV